MKEKGLILLFGGTGYIGRKLARLLLLRGHRVLIVARKKTSSFEKEFFSKFLEDERLNFLYRDVLNLTIYDLVSLQVVKHGIYAVINLVTSTTGSRRVIIRDNVLAVNKVLSLIRCIKSMWPKAIFIQLGSITELSYNSGSIYSKAKKEVRKIIQDSSMCDFHLVFGFTYGENPRMISDLRKILPFCYKYKSLLHGFRMACIHVEDLVKKIAFLLECSEEIKKYFNRFKFPLEVRIIGESFNLYQLLSVCFGSEELRAYQSAHKYSCLEKVMLFIRYISYRLTSFHSTFRRRMSFFCKLALLQNQKRVQSRLNYYQLLGNKEEIIKLIRKPDVYFLENKHFKIVIKNDGLIYII